MIKIPVETSARHIHLSQEDLKVLFGDNFELHQMRELSQPNEFAAKETLTIKTPKNSFFNVRIVGPVRAKTQVEISKSDAYILGLNPPIRISGDVANSEKCLLVGPKGQVELKEGVIVSWRHIHLNPDFLKKNNLNEKQLVSVKIAKGDRRLTFHDVCLRVSDHYEPAMHVDTDEANAAGLTETSEGELII
jgi:propanediol utilization protein